MATKQECESIIKDAKENWGDDIALGIAAHLHGANVVKKCGGIPKFANKRKISTIKGQITRLSKPKKKTTSKKVTKKTASKPKKKTTSKKVTKKTASKKQ